ncbi:MAG: hypothetical protein CM1200mP14_05180 [Gammaproteobacteria bacterium]|nr:MAG: hypothetical protein CM1200mP14_05180 [Gammaproteobacteria bacterium]
MEDRDPENIVLNVDPVWAFSDGLHAGEQEELLEALGDEYANALNRTAVGDELHSLAPFPEMMPRYQKSRKLCTRSSQRLFQTR